MFLRIASDLHCEFQRIPIQKYIDLVLPPDDRDEDSVLILAGDISCYKPQLKLVYELVCPRFHKVIHVAGNHEHYHSDIYLWNDWAKSTMQCFDNLSISKHQGALLDSIEDLDVIYATLWTNCGEDPITELAVENGMNDFYVIRNNARTLTLQNVRDTHLQEKAGIKTLSELTIKPYIVVTHHLPSYMLCHPRFNGSALNSGFASNSEDLFFKEDGREPLLWVYGHTHSASVMKLGNTWMVCNPHGYPGESSNYEESYMPRCFIDLESLIQVGSEFHLLD
jgi:predicted phosphodiesterase